LPIKSQLQAGSLSTTFLTSLALASFLAEAKRIFTNFPTAHHNLGSSRATPSRLGGFTSKSNKCHEDCFTKLKCSNAQRAHKEDSLNPNLDFSQITQTSQRGVGESSQRLSISVFRGWHQLLPKEGGGKLLYLPPQKLAVEN
jgi:hypothetical protein